MNIQQKLQALAIDHQRQTLRNVSQHDFDRPDAKANLEKIDAQYMEAHLQAVTSWLPEGTHPVKGDELTPLMAGELLLKALASQNANVKQKELPSTSPDHRYIAVVITLPHYKRHPQHCLHGLIRHSRSSDARSISDMGIRTSWNTHQVDHHHYQLLSAQTTQRAILT